MDKYASYNELKNQKGQGTSEVAATFFSPAVAGGSGGRCHGGVRGDDALWPVEPQDRHDCGGHSGDGYRPATGAGGDYSEPVGVPGPIYGEGRISPGGSLPISEAALHEPRLVEAQPWRCLYDFGDDPGGVQYF